MTRDRPDTIRCIVASLVGDGESGDSLVDENEPIQPLQQLQVDDYTDPNWEPEPIDAGPSKFPLSRFLSMWYLTCGAMVHRFQDKQAGRRDQHASQYLWL